MYKYKIISTNCIIRTSIWNCVLYMLYDNKKCSCQITVIYMLLKLSVIHQMIIFTRS